MLSIKKMNDHDLQKIYSFLSSLAPENGFENRFYGVSFESFKTIHYPQLMLESQGIDLQPGRVPQTYFFLFDDDRIVGLFKVRHYLNDFLKEGAGHIGYAIGKADRQKGYATKGLSLLLQETKNLIKEDEIYMSCKPTNVASLHVQLKNGAYIIHQDDNKILTRITKK